MNTLSAPALHARVAIAVLALTLTLASCAREPASLLPDTVGAWQATRPEEVFVGDELFMYINGGAEIYHEYGFEQVTVREYERGGDTIAVDVFTMRESAFGMYTFARSEKGTRADIGSGGTLADYYLHFWSGPHLVVVTAHGEFEGHQDSVLELGQVLGKRFPAAGESPALTRLMPRERTVPRSETYLQGPIALRNFAPVAGLIFSDFEEGLTARPHRLLPTDERIIVLVWSDERGAATAMDVALRRVSDRGAVTVEGDDTRLRVEFDSGDSISAIRSGARITFTVNPGDGSEPENIFSSTPGGAP